VIRLTLALYLTCLGVAQAAPYLPATGGQVLQAVPKRGDPQQQQLLLLKARLKAAPRDLASATAVARAYITAGRREADPRFYGYAQAALAPWWQEAAPPAEVRLLRATLRQATHQFGPALDDLTKLVRSEPANAEAWLTMATVQTVTGEYAAAIASCQALARLALSTVSAACLANPYAATGQAQRALSLLSAEMARAEREPEMQAWLAGIQGELSARLGDVAGAQRFYRIALAAAPDDSYLLGAYADLLLDQGRFSEVLQLMEAHDRVDALLLRRALALQALGDRVALAKAVAELEARFSAAARRGDAVHEREQARFVLQLKGDSGKAIELARHNWQVQKEVADARILLEAALAAKRPEAAQAAREWIAKHGMQDVVLNRLVKAAGGPI
jgi:predicted Zn-dependent protease